MVRLLPYEEQHFAKIQSWLANPELKEYFRRYPPPFTWLTCGTSRPAFATTYLVEVGGEVRGLTALNIVDGPGRRGEFGIALEPFPGRREACVEALRQLFDYAFNYAGLNKLSCLTLTHRESLKRLLADFKFKHEGTLRANVLFEGTFCDEDAFGLLKDEYLTISNR